MTRITTLIILIFLLFCVGCDDKNPAVSDTPTAKTIPKTEKNEIGKPVASPVASQKLPKDSVANTKTLLLHSPLNLKRYEFPSEALLSWYALRKTRPALLLYSKAPFLQSVTHAMTKDLLERLAKDEKSAMRFDTADPAILPQMTVDAALQAGFFSSVYWIIPSNSDASELSIERFRQQMVAAGAMDREEARLLTLNEGIFSGTARGVPFRALHPNANFSINGPVALHFDLSYFSPLYKSEIKTPLFPLVYQTLKHLRNQRLEAVDATFSYSQISGEVPLGSRFLGDIFAQIFLAPELLDKPFPADWRQRAKALYLPELFNTSTAREALMQLQSSHPEDPSLDYALYQISRQSRSIRHEALNHLADAVQLDPVYATEYLYLARLAREKGRPAEATHVLQLAAAARPDNPFVTLELARALIADGQTEDAASLLKQLQGLRWSKQFYPAMPSFLEKLHADAVGSQ